MDSAAQAESSGGSLDRDGASIDDLTPEPSPGALIDSETELFRRWRDELTDASGLGYAEIKKQLTPRYAWLWTQIGLAYLFTASIVVALVMLQPVLSTWWQYVIAVWLGALGIGFLVAFFALWFHEATHFHLHPNRMWNDRLANWLLGILLIHDVRTYRRVHFAHHKHLGECEDTERNYFDALGVRTLLESLTGIKVMRTLLIRSDVKKADVSKATNSPETYREWVSTTGKILHFAVICTSVYFGEYMLAAAWAVGVISMFPFFAALRQLMEHRRPDADPACDYTQEAHGAYTRIFKGRLFANTFGGAGFNRHLIHHWDPGISCTRFVEMECFLEQSQLGEFYRSRKTTYADALRLLLRQSASGKSVDA